LLKHLTLDQLNALGLYGMAKAFTEVAAAGEAKGLGHHEWLGLLLDREVSWRRDKRLAARLRIAKLRQQESIEDVDYRNPRGLDRACEKNPSASEARDPGGIIRLRCTASDRKGQMVSDAGENLSASEQFYSLAALNAPEGATGPRSNEINAKTGIFALFLSGRHTVTGLLQI
jgi:hypothetical protein